MSEFAIEVKHLDKMYKLYNKPSDRLREALGFKVPVREHYALRDVNKTSQTGIYLSRGSYGDHPERSYRQGRFGKAG